MRRAWSQKEEACLLALVQEYGTDWDQVSKELTNRTPTMRVAFEILKANLGTESATTMCYTLPEKIFRNQDVVLESPLDYEPPQRSLFGSLFKR